MTETKKRGGMSSATWRRICRFKWLYVMLLPGVIYYLIFKYGPMVGLLAAFKDYQPFLGFFQSPWVVLKHFARFFGGDSFLRILGNHCRYQL